MWLVWTLVVVSEPALLVEPSAARAAALEAEPTAARSAAETLALLGDGAGVLKVLRNASVDRSDPRVIRLQIEARIAMRDDAGLRRAADQLAGAPEWAALADRASAAVGAIRRERLLTRIGLGVFALALALLAIGGARGLLALDRPTLVFAVAGFAAVALVSSTAPRAAPLVGLLGGGCLALVHAAWAAVDRTRPDARGRLLAVSLMLLGAMGLGGALVVRMPVSLLHRLLAGA